MQPTVRVHIITHRSIHSPSTLYTTKKLNLTLSLSPTSHRESQLLEQPAPSPRQGTLTRQQTFPPVQPYARMRYMSTTAEMSQCCTEVLLEGDSSSSRSCSPAAPQPTSLEAERKHSGMDSLSPPAATTLTTSTSASGELRRHSTPAQSKSGRGATVSGGHGRRFTTIPLTQESQQEPGHKVFFIGSPPDSPPRLARSTPSSDSGSGSVGGGGSGEPRKSVDSLSLPGNKRDYSDSSREKSSKMLKLMKENVDPRAAVTATQQAADDIKGALGLSNRRSNNQVGAACRL